MPIAAPQHRNITTPFHLAALILFLFAATLASAAPTLTYSTYLPLDVFDAHHNIAVDDAGNAFQPSNQPGDDASLIRIVPGAEPPPPPQGEISVFLPIFGQ